MNKYTQTLLKWTLATMCLAPALSWAHGALDSPPARAVNCQVTGGHWQSEDGSSIVDRGCRESSKIFNTPADRAFAPQQWNEVAHIPHIEHPTLDQIKGIIKDGQICAAGDPKKASLDQPTPYWTKTEVTPGQSLTIRLIGTAPHVPSTFYAFITRPGFNTASDTLKWSDLEQLGQIERFTVANTAWQTPPLISGASGFFLITRTLPSSASGNGLIVGIWVRDDPNGEFFISCSDVKFQGGGVPDPLNNIGPFIGADMLALKPDDSVHFRIFGNDGAQKELVDITQKISTANLAPGQWGKEIADKVNASVAIIGELEDQTVKFNQEKPLVNSTFVTHNGYTQAMSIIPGGGPVPIDSRPPVAVIKPHAPVKSGERFTMDGTGSTVYNTGAAGWQWDNNFQGGAFHESTATFTAPEVQQAKDFTVSLRVYDNKNTTSTLTNATVTVNPSSGGEKDTYEEGHPYKAGEVVINKSKKYKCKPHPYTDWCAGAAWAYAPGTGLHWTQAWDLVP